MMAPLITILVLLLAIGVLVYSLRRSRRITPRTAPEPTSAVRPQPDQAKANPYEALRTRALAMQAAELGLTPAPMSGWPTEW